MSIWSMDRDDRRRLAHLGKSGKITGEENGESDDDHYFPIVACSQHACLTEQRASRTFNQLLLSSRGEFFFPLRKLKFIAHLLESLAVVGKNPFPGRDEDFYALCSGTGTESRERKNTES